MSAKPVFYYLSTKGMDPCCLTNEDYYEATQTWLCKGCKLPKRGIGAVDVTLEGPHPPNTPINLVSATGVGVVKREFLDELGEETVQRDLLIGKVFNESNEEMSSYASFRGRHLLIVRGTKNASYRKCVDCGRRLYFANPKWYLYPEPPSDTDAFQSHNIQLVLSERAFERLTPKKWERSLYIVRLEVLDAPLDGFPELLSME